MTKLMYVSIPASDRMLNRLPAKTPELEPYLNIRRIQKIFPSEIKIYGSAIH